MSGIYNTKYLYKIYIIHFCICLFIYSKTPLIGTEGIYGQRANLLGLYSGQGVSYIREEEHFNLKSVKLTFLSFSQYKARIFHVAQDVKYVES